MLADDTNLFYSHKNINVLFLKVNNKLHKINCLFLIGSHSLSKKQNVHFFNKRSKKDDISLLLPKLKINNYQLKWAESIKFLGVVLDKNLT